MKYLLFILFIFIHTNAYSKDRYSNAILCSSIYFIASGAYGDNRGAAEMLMANQRSFEVIYAANQKRSVSNGEISKLKHEHLMYLGKLFDSDPQKVFRLEMQCNSWKEEFKEQFIYMSKNAKDWNDVIKLVNNFPKFKKIKFSSKDRRWESSMKMMNSGFEYWDLNKRMTPYQFKENLKNQ